MGGGVESPTHNKMISVIIPCHNYGTYLTDCIHSLIGGDTSLGKMNGQSFEDFEAIIVNDASTDDTHKIAAQFSKHEKIEYIRIHKHRVGTAEAFNIGIRISNGQWIMQLSADDMLESDALQLFYNVQVENQHSFVYGNQQLFAYGKKLRYFFKNPQAYDFESNLIENHIPGSMMYPKTAWQEIGGIPNMPNGREDWATGIALGIYGYCGVYLHRSGYLYRREGTNRSAKGTIQDHISFAQRIVELFPEIYGGYRPMACCGKGGRQTSSRQGGGRGRRASVIPKALAGSGGMSQLRYTGKEYGLVTWWGGKTGIGYKAGRQNPRIYVDNRDLDHALSNWKEGDRVVFVKVARKIKPVKLPPKQSERIKPIESVEEKDPMPIIDAIEQVVVNNLVKDEPVDVKGNNIVDATTGAINLAKQYDITLELIAERLEIDRKITKRDVQRFIKDFASNSVNI